MRIFISLITLWVFVFSTGCQANPVDVETPLEAISSPVPAPTQGDTTQMTPPLPTPATSGLQNLIETAKADLAQRLSIPATQINVVEVKEVEWPDSSLGCPQPGMAYTQVITPGHLILLEHNNTKFEYHANRKNSIIYCQNPFPPIPGKAGDNQ